MAKTKFTRSGVSKPRTPPPKKPALERFTQLVGDEVAIGFMRTDIVPLAHVIVQCPPGAAFQVGPHFSECPICRGHGVTEEDFAAYMNPAGRRVHGAEAAGAGDLGQVDEVMTGAVIGKCPSCHADLSIGSGIDPSTGKPASSMLHPMPFCSYFGKTSPEDILKALGL